MNKGSFSKIARWWADLPLRRKGLIVVSIPFGALLFGFVAIYTAQKTEDRAEDWLVRTELVRSDLRAARNALIDAETSVRGFVISGDEKFLLPYQRAQTVFLRRARDVEELLEDNPDQLRHLAELKNLVAARFSAFAKLIEAARQKNEHVFDAQRSQLVQEGDMPMEQVRAKFREMDQAEDRLDVEENKNLYKLRKTASITIGFSAAFGVLGGLAAILLFSRGIVRRIQVIENNAAHLANELPLESVQNADDEIGRLGQRLKDTSRLLEQRRNALRRETEHLANEVKERERSEEALRQNKARLEVAIHTNQLIMDNSRDVICTVDKAGRFVTVSAACETLWGYKPKEVIGRRYIEMVYPEDQARTNQAALDIMAGSATTDFENRYICKDGSLIDVMWSSYWSEEDGMMFAVAHDVTERTRLKKVLQQAKDDADRANHAKSEFLSRMSHELRTPLNAILGFGQLLQRQNPTDTQRDRISHILSAGRHLLGLINEVLDISRIEAGHLQLSLEPVSIVDALGEAIDLMRPLAAERSTELMSPRREDTEYYVLSDRQRLKQVLLNLLTNAVKYTPPGGRVMVSCTSLENEQIRIVVSDNGPGIPIEKLSRLFTPFDRLGAEQSDVEGTGLGLALCQRLLQAMRGVIGVNSSVGEGSSFWIELPRTESPLERVSSLKELAISQSKNTAPADKRRILYIEDNLSNLRLIEQMIQEKPEIELMTAMQGKIGLDLARKHFPDLILLDLHLPDLPGWEVLSQLKADKTTRHIPAVVISADATAHQINRLMDAGARAYLTKPLDVEEFFRVLEKTTPLTNKNKQPAMA